MIINVMVSFNIKIRKEIEIKINEHTNDFVTKKQNQEEVINKLIEEIDVSTCKGNDLNVTYKKVKKGEQLLHI